MSIIEKSGGNMNNKKIMQILTKYPNLQELKYQDNTLTYQGKNIDISNVNLYDFFKNYNHPMYINQKIISAEDFFNILQTTSLIIEPLDNQNNQEKNYNIININHYNSILNKTNILTPLEQKELNNFNTYISNLLTYREYLLQKELIFLKQYLNLITNIRMLEIDNPEITLTHNQQQAIDTYDFLTTNTNQEQNIISRKKVFNKPPKTGYIDLILLILIIISSGITLGSIIFINIF